MPYSREKFSSLWIIIWIILFFSGMGLIFSFLLGNPFFSGEIKGKYIFSSDKNSSLYVNGEFVGKEYSDKMLPLGTRKFCSSKYFFKTRCFDGEIRSNAFKILDLKNISLFPRNFRIDNITSEKVYFDPIGNGLFWIDNKKKVIFGIRKDGESFFIKKLIFKKKEEKNNSIKNLKNTKTKKEVKYIVSYNIEKKNFEINIGDNFYPIYISFSENFMNLSEVTNFLSNKNSNIIISNTKILKMDDKYDKKNVIISFSDPIRNVYSFQKNKILEFYNSVWIFTPEKNQINKLFSKDKGSQIFWHPKTSSLFFIIDNKLKRLFLK